MLVGGFGMQLYAAITVDGRDRKRPERVCRHILRRPLPSMPRRGQGTGAGSGPSAVREASVAWHPRRSSFEAQLPPQHAGDEALPKGLA